MNWGERILEKYNKCAICESKKQLEPHHIIQTNTYDEFHNSLDNGTVLCHNCHHKYHQQYYGDINLKTLLEFKAQHERQQCQKYRSKYKKKTRQYNKLKKEYDNIKIEHQKYDKLKEIYNDCRKTKEIIKEKLILYQKIAAKHNMPSTTKLDEYIDKLITENKALKDAQDGLVATIAHFEMEEWTLMDLDKLLFEYILPIIIIEAFIILQIVIILAIIGLL